MRCSSWGHRLCLAATAAWTVIVSTPSPAATQQTTMVRVSATVRASATVEATELVFGVVRPGTEYSVEPRPDSPVGTPGVVVFDLTTTQVFVTVPGRITLHGPLGQMDAVLRCAHAVAPVALSVPRQFACDHGQQLLFEVDGHERRLIYVGGIIDAESSHRAAPGLYRGALRVTASFTTF